MPWQAHQAWFPDRARITASSARERPAGAGPVPNCMWDDRRDSSYRRRHDPAGSFRRADRDATRCRIRRAPAPDQHPTGEEAAAKPIAPAASTTERRARTSASLPSLRRNRTPTARRPAKRTRIACARSVMQRFPPAARGLQIGVGCAKAAAAPLRGLHRSHAFDRPAGEILVERQAPSMRRVYEQLGEGVHGADIGNMERARASPKFVFPPSFRSIRRKTGSTSA